MSAVEAALPPLDDGETQQSLRNNGDGVYGINISDGDTLRFPSLVSQSTRSLSFGMTKNDFFAIEGAVIELDSAGTVNEYTTVYLGGIEGVRAVENGGKDAIRPVFQGSDLLASPSRFHDLTFSFGAGDNIYTGGSSVGSIAGSVSLFFVVS